MNESLFSQSWYRVATLKPRLRGHARIHRHEYRGAVWYVLEDTLSGRCHRLSASTHYLIGLMDGRRTVQTLWDAACERLDDDAPTQDETIRLLAEMHAADVLLCDLPPDSQEIFDRRERQEERKRLQVMAQPLAIRIPLFDPDAFLTRTLPLVRPLIGWFGLVLWLAVVSIGAVLAAAHWPELTGNLLDQVLSIENLLVLWLAYPLVKAVHELGHGYCARHWGGEVHEVGIMLLVLMPVPYVEASAASAFREKHRRAFVGAAGIMVELFLAALAMMLWVAVEPGLVRALAFNVMLIGGVSTFLFNGNPLLRFDGYYVLCDLVEIPNLATRSNKYIGYLIQRYLFGLPDAESPVGAPGERTWFVAYGLASFAYRMFIMTVIVLFIAGQFFVVGVLLAIWAVSMQIVKPLIKHIGFLLNSPKLDRRRTRAVLVSAAIAAAAALFVVLVPLPSWTRAEGVVWLPQQAEVRAQESGIVTRVLAAPDAWVEAGDPLVASEDPLLRRRVELLAARARELQARLTQAQVVDRTKVQVVREEITVVRAELTRARAQLEALVLRSHVRGRLVLVAPADLPGRFLRRGELIGYVTDPAQASVRVAVGQDDIGLVRGRTESVDLWVADWQTAPAHSRVLRQIPAATDELPSPAFGTAGGGSFASDPRDATGLRSLEPLFVVDLELPPDDVARFLGRRVAVRFGHGLEPLAVQWYRGLRQLFLSRFGV